MWPATSGGKKNSSPGRFSIAFHRGLSPML